MSGLALIWDAEAQEARLVVADAEQPDAALRTAALISLFTDRRATADDVLPEPGADRRGWWADVAPPVEGDLIGSRHWLSHRGKRRPEDIRLARDRAAEALAWMIADGVASAVTVEAEALGDAGIALSVAITRPEGPTRQTFDFLWEFH
ncbi:MAG: hypothetical protein GC145_18530 [Caulobacter sp.]|nr:hypothetical protein [Caulobacter sp.]